MPSDYRPRLSVDITPDQREQLDKILGQYGLQRAVFSIIIDDLINSVNTHGHRITAGLLSRALTLQDILREVDDEH